MIDTHTHLYLEEFNPDGDSNNNEPRGAAAVKRALEAGIEHFIFPNVDLESYAPMLDLHHKFPEQTSIAIGLHPTSVGDSSESDLEMIKALLDSGDKVVAIGEVGLDLYWDKTFREQQIEAFRQQIEWAIERRLPVIIHCRKAMKDTLNVLKEFGERLPQVLFHSFTGSKDDVKAIREVTDAYFGINGVVTYKNAAELREALPEIGLNRIVLETDSPYLSPVPKRGRRNESSYIPFIADCIASVIGKSREEISRVTDANAKTLFY